MVVPENDDSCLHPTFAVVLSGQFLTFLALWTSDDHEDEGVNIQIDSIRKLDAEVSLKGGAR